MSFSVLQWLQYYILWVKIIAIFHRCMSKTQKQYKKYAQEIINNNHQLLTDSRWSITSHQLFSIKLTYLQEWQTDLPLNAVWLYGRDSGNPASWVVQRLDVTSPCVLVCKCVRSSSSISGAILTPGTLNIDVTITRPNTVIMLYNANFHLLSIFFGEFRLIKSTMKSQWWNRMLWIQIVKFYQVVQ